MKKYPWYDRALKEKGIRETPGTGDNPRVVEYLKSTNIGPPEDHNDETPWCSAFVNWVMANEGYEGTNSAWSRSWLHWGREPEDSEFGQGVIVILSRGPHFGHVGFLADWDDESVQLLGGNQGDAVSLEWFSQDRVIGWRIPD